MRWLAIMLSCLLAFPVLADRLDDSARQLAGFDPHPGARVPGEVTFSDSQGHPVKLGELIGQRPTVLALVYHACPNLCGLSIGGLIDAVRGQRLRPGQDFNLVVLSFDPREGPQQARTARHEALRRVGGDASGWHFLTGSLSAIQRVTRAVGFRYAWDDELQQYAHPSGLVLLTPEGRIARYLYGLRPQPRDLRLGLVDAGKGAIGGLTEQVLLLCYHYDPQTGRYGGLVLNLVRFAGALLLLTMFGLWLHWRRREGDRG